MAIVRQRDIERMNVTEKRGGIGRGKRIPWVESLRSRIGEDIMVKNVTERMVNGIERTKEIGTNHITARKYVAAILGIETHGPPEKLTQN